MLAHSPGEWSYTFLTSIERDMKNHQHGRRVRFKNWASRADKIPGHLRLIAEAKTCLERLSPWYIDPDFSGEAEQSWELATINKRLNNQPL